MLFFPSLASNAIVQLPSSYETSARIAEARSISDYSYWYVDQTQRYKIWRLRYQYLTNEERQTLSDFYRSTGGCLQTFVFVSPFENLLSHSDPSPEYWSIDAQLSVQYGQADPRGGLRAVLVSNPSLLAGRMRRSVMAPAWFRYTTSIYTRGSNAANVNLYATGGVQSTSISATTRSDWARCSFTFSNLSPASLLETGIDIPPLTELYLYGAQLEASAVATDYKPTESRCGIYEKCRFVRDTLEWQTDAPNCHSTDVEIMTRI